MGADLEEQYRPPACCAPSIKALCESWLPAIREAALECGYAVGVHGSMARDLDLILCPWVADAASPLLVTRTIVDALRRLLGDDGVYYRMDPAQGPHGRTWANIHMQPRHLVQTANGAFPFIDVSIMPKLG